MTEHKDYLENLSERMTTKEAAAYCKLSKKTLDGYRCDAKGPKFIKLGRLVFYKKSDLDSWIEENSGYISTAQARIGKRV